MEWGEYKKTGQAVDGFCWEWLINCGRVCMEGVQNCARWSWAHQTSQQVKTWVTDFGWSEEEANEDECSYG